VSEQEFISAKAPKTKLLHSDDPKEDQRERVLSLGRDGEIESDLIAEPEASQQGRDI
jgi:hypothetical protein